jgi:uncharacterized protein (DUF1697 family)
VGGNKTVRMAELKALLDKTGYKNVRTLLNSGNVVFETDEEDKKKVTQHIEDALEKKFGWRIAVMIRSMDELQKIVDKNPYKKDSDFRTYISFLSEEPEKTLVKDFETLQTSDEKFTVQGREVYASLRGMGTAKVFNLLEKKLKVFATNRNTNTIEKLVSL